MSPAQFQSHPHRLSKSRAVAGWRCPRYLWWKVHKADAPELRPSLADRDRMEQGTAVGKLATRRFPGGVEIEYAPDELDRMARETRAALNAGAPAVFEASFMEDDVFVAVDILERLDPEQSTDAFRLIEVKATSSPKDEHIPDAAVQLHVLRNAGVEVREVALMHLNRDYRHPGPEDLFALTDITAQAEAFQPEVPALLASCREVLQGAGPGPLMGDRCTRFHCPLTEVCWPREPDHVRRLNGVGLKKALAHMEAGVHTFGDLGPEARIGDKARRQLESWRAGGLKVEETLKDDLRPFRGRLGFLDFETIMRAVPPWDGLAPYEQVPVQFSYHERQADGTVTHTEWLAPGPGDPRKPLAEALVRAARDADAVVTYTGYEKRCIRALQDAAPELALELDRLLSRLLDLEKVVGRNLAHPDFMGKTSIKYVLTPLVPELSYEGMEVADGMAASVRLARLILGEGALAPENAPTSEDPLSPEAREAERRALLDYCKLDTLAMVRLLERLEGLAGI